MTLEFIEGMIVGALAAFGLVAILGVIRLECERREQLQQDAMRRHLAELDQDIEKGRTP